MIFIKNNSQLIWEKVIENGLQFDATFKVLPTKGNMAWEYNPLRNLRLNEDMYEYDNKLHTFKLNVNLNVVQIYEVLHPNQY